MKLSLTFLNGLTALIHSHIKSQSRLNEALIVIQTKTPLFIVESLLLSTKTKTFQCFTYIFLCPSILTGFPSISKLFRLHQRKRETGDYDKSVSVCLCQMKTLISPLHNYPLLQPPGFPLQLQLLQWLFTHNYNLFRKHH